MTKIELIGFRAKTRIRIPLFTMSVSAGLPVPVDDNVDQEIDLNEFLVEHPASTFFARVKGNDMREAGIYNNDILIIDTSIEPEDGKIILASVNNELTIKYYRDIDGDLYLESQDRHFIPLSQEIMDLQVIGVVKKIIHSL